MYAYMTKTLCKGVENENAWKLWKTFRNQLPGDKQLSRGLDQQLITRDTHVPQISSLDGLRATILVVGGACTSGHAFSWKCQETHWNACLHCCCMSERLFKTWWESSLQEANSSCNIIWVSLNPSSPMLSSFSFCVYKYSYFSSFSSFLKQPLWHDSCV